MTHSIDSVVSPSVLKNEDTDYLSFKLKDVFGNAITDANVFDVYTDSNSVTISRLSADYSINSKAYFIRAPRTSTEGWDEAAQSYRVELVSMTDDPFVVNIDMSTDYVIRGFPKPSNRLSLVVNGGASSDLVAKLEKIIDRKVSKKKYNKLARMWNADNPTKKVALKK
jgi:hypothetical protein